MALALVAMAFFGAPAHARRSKREATRVLVLDLKPIGIDDEAVAALSASVAVRVGRHRALQVLSGADVRRMADLAAERSATGCDTEQCLTELAGAIGADVVIFGEAARVDDLTVVTLGVLDQQRASVLSRQSARASALAPLLRTLDQKVDVLLVDAGLVDDDDVADAGGNVGPLVAVGGGVVAAAGVVGVGVGLIPLFQYNAAAERVRTATSESAADVALAEVQSAQAAHATWGLPLLIGGGAAVLIGAGVLAVGVVVSGGSEP